MRAMLTTVFAAAVALYGATAAAEVTFKLGHTTFESHPNHDTAVRFKEAVERLTKGEVKIQIYPARQLGDVKELVQGVQFATLDMAVLPTTAYSTQVPAMDAFQLPWLIGSYEHFANIALSPEAKAIMKSLDAHGTTALGVYDGGLRHFLSVKRPVRAIEDFQGQKTRVAPSKLYMNIWKAVNVNPTPMAYGEVYTGLETGTLDAVEINLTSIQSEKLYEIAKNVTLTGQYFWPSLLVINKGKLDKLTPEQRNAVVQAADEIVRPQVMAVEELDKKLMVELKTHGVTIIEPSPELLAAARQRVQPVIDGYVKENPAIAGLVAAAERTRPAASKP